MPSGIYIRTKVSALKGRKRPPRSDEWRRNLSSGHMGINAGEKHPFWGKHHSEETKRKIGLAHKGKIESDETRQKKSISHIGLVSPNKGKTFSKEWRENLGKSHKGLNTWLKDKKLSIEHRQKISEAFKGDKNWNWRGGINNVNDKIRKSFEYKLWRESVFARDNFTCVGCRQIGGELNADHIKPFSLYPELRFAIDNGRTLCVPCHKKTDTYAFKMKTYVKAD